MEMNDNQTGSSGRQYDDVLLLVDILQKKLRGSYNSDFSKGVEKVIIYAEFDMVHHFEHEEIVDGYYCRKAPSSIKVIEKLSQQEYLDYIRTLITTDEPGQLKNLVDNTFALLYHIIDGADLDNIAYRESEAITAPKMPEYIIDKDKNDTAVKVEIERRKKEFKESEEYKLWEYNKKLRDNKRKSIIKQTIVGKGATRKTYYLLVEPQNSQLSYYVEEHFKQKKVGYIWGNIKSKSPDSAYVLDKLLSSLIDDKLVDYDNADLSPSELREIINQEYINKLEVIIGERVRGNSEKKLNEYLDQIIELLNHKPHDWIKKCSELFDKTIRYYNNEVSALSYAELLVMRAGFISEFGLYHEYRKHNSIPNDWLNHMNSIYERALELIVSDKGKNEQYAECATKFTEWLLSTSQFEKVAMYVDVIVDIYKNLAINEINDNKHKLQYADALCYKAEYNRHIGDLSTAEVFYKLSIDEINKCPNNKHIEAKRWLDIAVMHSAIAYENTEEEFLKSISIYESIIRKNHRHKKDLAMSLLCYAQYLELQERHEKLSDVYDKTIIIYRELAETKENEAIADLAWNLYIVGYHHYHNERYKKAYDLFYESLSLFKELHNKVSNKYLKDISVVLVGIGNVQKDEGESNIAVQSYIKALDYAKKASPYSNEGEAYIASVLLKIAELYFTMNEMVLSEKHYTEALELYKNLAQKNHSYNKEIADILVRLSEINIEGNHRKILIERFVEALYLYQLSYNENDIINSLSILELRKKLAALYKLENDNAQEERELEEIVKLTEKLTAWNSQLYSTTYVDALGDLQSYYDNYDDVESMLKVNSMGLDAYEATKVSGYDAISKLAIIIQCCSLKLLIDGRNNESEKWFNNLLKIYYCLDAMKPNSVNNELVETLSCIGHAQNWEGKFDEAAKTYKKALSLLEDTFCDKNIKMIADLYDNLAVVYDSQELYTECVDALSKALLFYKKYTEQGGNCQEKIDEIINIFTTNNIQIPTL